MKAITIHIEGMSCGHCLNAVNRALAAVPGVQPQTVTIGRADVRYDEATVDPARITSAIEDAGYRAAVAP